jgi:D-sedoheptulose 7-phosphate isomerase
MTTIQRITGHFTAVATALSQVDPESVAVIARKLATVKEQSGTAWIIGNGGSAATASHFANDLRKIAQLRAIALPDLTPTITAYGNDNGWDSMYSHPLDLFLTGKDCLVAISCSGRSRNVVEAATQAGPGRLVIITGSPDPRNRLATLPKSGIVYAQSDDIKVQESVHSAVCHAIVAAMVVDPSQALEEGNWNV